MTLPTNVQTSLRAFRKRYYQNELLRGLFLLLLIISSVFLILIFGEGLFNFSVNIRTVLFFGFIALSGFIFFKMIMVPVLKLYNISRQISDIEAAKFVGNKIPEISDKLLNIVQLSSNDDLNNELLIAAINHKATLLSVFPVTKAVNFAPTLKFGRYLFIPLGILFIVFFLSPEVLTQGSTRLINFGTDFPPPPPFSIVLDSVPETVEEGKSIKVSATVYGNEIPSELNLFVEHAGSNQWIPLPMNADGKINFSADVADITEDLKIKVGNGKVTSEVKEITVKRYPSLSNFKIILNYPAYTNKKSDTLPENVGDITAIKGTIVKWIVKVRGDVTSANLSSSNGLFKGEKNGKEEYLFKASLFLSSKYRFILMNTSRNINKDSLDFLMNVEDDKYPSVMLRENNYDFNIPVTGLLPLDVSASDDYGINKLEFRYRFITSSDKQKISEEFKVLELPGTGRSFEIEKLYEVDLFSLGLNQGEAIEYQIRVWDNDGILGSKFSETSIFKAHHPSLEKLYEEQEEKQEEVSKELADLSKQVADFNKALEKFQNKLSEKKSLEYSDQKELKNLLEKQQQVNQSLKQLDSKMKQNISEQKENELFTPELLNKLENLQQLMKDIQNPKLDEYLKKLQEQLEKLRPDEIRKQLEDTKLDREALEKDMERTMKLLNQFKAEQKVEELIKKLDNLKNQQDELNKKNEENNKSEERDKLSKEQEELSKKMEDIKKDLAELDSLKSGTETPQNEEMKDIGDKQQSAQQSMKQAASQMKQNNKQSSKEQKNASDKMQQMIDKLDQMQSDAESEEQAENIEDLTDILENLIKISFDEEALRDGIRPLRFNDPSLPQKAQLQRKLKDDMGMISDSLYALAGRVPEIKKMITDEVVGIQKHIDRSLNHLNDRNIGFATGEQQAAMTGINNLANFLSNELENMMKQMQKSSSSSSSKKKLCKKKKPGPGEGKSMSNLSQQQRSVNQKLQEMMKLGKADPKELGRIAAQQELIRQMLQSAEQQLKDEGKPGLGKLDKIKSDMELTEQELINNNLTQETLMRQQKILNRMLDATKSVRERDMEERRESQTGKEIIIKKPAELNEKKTEEKLVQELLKSKGVNYQDKMRIVIDRYFDTFQMPNGNRN